MNFGFTGQNGVLSVMRIDDDNITLKVLSLIRLRADVRAKATEQIANRLRQYSRKPGWLISRSKLSLLSDSGRI